jgi:hypothetical protein
VNPERGAASIWFLGLGLAVMMVGAVSAELWRIIGERQELSAMAESAAIAAAGTIDLDRYRADGSLVIDREEGVRRALAAIARHSGGDDLAASPLVAVAADGGSVRVALSREVPFGLIRLLSLEGGGFTVDASAVAYPFVP